jgi:TIR domain
MDIFISWHGRRSHAAAEALREWLPQTVNAFKPWLSSADIDKGARWSPEIAAKLATAKAGIICLTPSNLTAPWILFEAGALSKTVERTQVCTLLIGLEPSDVTDPLAQFQATRATEDDLLGLVKNLNKALGEESLPEPQLEKAFKKWWPDLEKELNALPAEAPTASRRRPDRELLEELLDLARTANSQIAQVGQLLMDTVQPQSSGIADLLNYKLLTDSKLAELADRINRLRNTPGGLPHDELRQLEADLAQAGRMADEMGVSLPDAMRAIKRREKDKPTSQPKSPSAAAPVTFERNKKKY